jgi:hypothetical protein
LLRLKVGLLRSTNMTNKQFLLSKIEDFLNKEKEDGLLDEDFVYEQLSLDMTLAAEHVYNVWQKTCSHTRNQYGD